MIKERERGKREERWQLPTKQNKSKKKESGWLAYETWMSTLKTGSKQSFFIIHLVADTRGSVFLFFSLPLRL